MRYNNIEWKFQSERKNAIFYCTIYFKQHLDLLNNATGFQFNNQLCVHEHDMAAYYYAKGEVKDGINHFFTIVRKNNPKLKQWQKQGQLLLKKEQKLIEKFKQGVDAEAIKEQYSSVMKECLPIFLYCTTIPYYVLAAIDSVKPEEQKKLTKILEMFQPFRKTTRVIFHDLVFAHIWKAAAQYANWPDYKDFSYFTIDELGQLFRGEHYPSKIEIAKRKNGCLFYMNKTKKIVFDYDVMLMEESTQQGEVKGLGAYNGHAKGMACIINRYDEMHKFKEGDIIVSINANPSIIPVLQKAGAIVTDEGGLTNHAAIIARELKIPCIIGTKIATKVFKDGDIVEVDANKGIVRKIK